MATDISSVLNVIERHQRRRRLFSAAALAALILVTGVGATFLGFTVAELWRQLPVWLDSVGEFVSPDFVRFSIWSQANNVEGWAGLYRSLLHPATLVRSLVQQEGIIGASVVTIVIGFTGTVIGFPLALLFGVLGSERVTPFPFNFIFRGTMSTIRAVPALVWILIYVPLAGISPVSAMLAVGTDTIGNLGRLFTDELEEIDEGPIEAIRSTGASGSQTVVFGMLSQVHTSFIAWTLYILEINVRIAISLGVVGAGGIGQYINLRIGLLAFSQAAAGIFMVIVIVISVELVSSRLRARLRPGEHEGTGLLESLRNLGDMGSWIGSGSGPR
ncbi:MAG: PhnE/PtxC family ABC transporter permease [Halobacteriales archaeon]